MHRMKVGVITQNRELFNEIAQHLPNEAIKLMHFDNLTEVAFGFNSLHMVFIDSAFKQKSQAIEQAYHEHIYSVLVECADCVSKHLPNELVHSQVDDILLLPIRLVELLSKIKHATHRLRLQELAHLNQDVKTLLTKFEEDIKITRSIQKSLIPEKYPNIRGLKINHRYLSGMKSGGDYLDVFEFEDQSHVAFLLSDSTGYGLSSAFMAVILRLAIKLNHEESKSPAKTIAKIYQELLLTMKPKEELAIFYGLLNKKTFELTYTGCGAISFLLQRDKKIETIALNQHTLSKQNNFSLKDQSLKINPNDRLLLFSDGFLNAIDQNLKQLSHTLQSAEESLEVVNYFMQAVKSKFSAEDDMPEQDCSLMIIDVAKNVMRLAQSG